MYVPDFLKANMIIDTECFYSIILSITDCILLFPDINGVMH